MSLDLTKEEAEERERFEKDVIYQSIFDQEKKEKCFLLICFIIKDHIRFKLWKEKAINGTENESQERIAEPNKGTASETKA